MVESSHLPKLFLPTTFNSAIYQTLTRHYVQLRFVHVAWLCKNSSLTHMPFYNFQGVAANLNEIWL